GWISTRVAWRTRARAAGRSSPPSTRARRRRCSARRCSNASARAARICSRTSSSRPCASSSADTSSRRAAASTMERSDALVFFGATGDLAYKKIFPALHSMAHRGTLDVPVIGVAKAGWTRDQLLERARASIAEHGGGVDEAAFARLAQRLDYVDGDYADPETFANLRRALGGAQRPTHYLAIPPSLFSAVVKALGGSGCATGGRVVIEKPFGHNRASAQALNDTVHSVFPE